MSRRSHPALSSSKSVSREDAEILKNSRRRGIIKALSSDTGMLDSLVGLFLEQENDSEPVGKRDLSDQVAVWEQGVPLDEISYKKLKSVYATIHQHHLDILDEEDLINRYPHEGLVEPLPGVDDYTELIEDRPHKESAFPGADNSRNTDSVLTTDQAYDALSNGRRRQTLSYMGNSRDVKFSVGELSEHLARLEQPDGDSITSGERKAAYVGLAQCHLPMLDETEVIDYDDNRKNVRRGRHFEDVTSYLPADSESISEPGVRKAKALGVLPLF